MCRWLLIRVKDAVAECFTPKHKQPSKQALSSDIEYNKYRAANRKELDRILDKITKYGMKSLTKREKRFLDEEKTI